MELTINGEKKDVVGVQSLEGLMGSLGFPPQSRGVAVALNGAVVPRSAWPTTGLNPGDTVEVIHAVQGG